MQLVLNDMILLNLRAKKTLHYNIFPDIVVHMCMVIYQITQFMLDGNSTLYTEEDRRERKLKRKHKTKESSKQRCTY